MPDRRVPPFVYHPDDKNLPLGPRRRWFRPRRRQPKIPILRILRDFSPDRARAVFPWRDRRQLDRPFAYPIHLPSRSSQIWLPSADPNGRSFLDRLPAAVLNAAKQGELVFALDYSAEGTSRTTRWLAETHECFDRAGIPAARAMLLTQNSLGPAEMAAWAETHGRSSFMNAVPAHFSLLYSFFHYRRPGDLIDTGLKSGQETARDGRRRPHRFLSLNRRMRAHRLVLVLHLLAHGRLDDSLISFGTSPSSDEIAELTGEMFGTDSAIFENTLEHAREFAERLPIFLDIDFAENHQISAVRQFDFDLFGNSYIGLLTETDYATEHVVRFTEKTWKTIAACQPFVLVGVKGLLAELRGLGFRTFSPLIDERYDAEPDPARRMELILAEVDRLSKLSMDEIHDLYVALWPALEHNARHLETAAGNVFDEFAERIFDVLAR